jgi:hypothetical protein
MCIKSLKALMVLCVFSWYSMYAIVSKESVACFRNIIEEGELFYLDLEQSKTSSLDEKLDVLDALYAYKNKWLDCVDFDAERLFLPLTREVIRRLENHLEDEHDWKQQRYCVRTLKPLLATGGFSVFTLLLIEFLYTYGVISCGVYDKTTIATCTSMSSVLTLWLLYNYRQELYRLGRKKKEII